MADKIKMCSEPDCQEEAVRYCFSCVEYFCAEHSCEHLNSIQYGKSWLSIPAVIERISDAELESIRLRLVTQLHAIDHELFERKYNASKGRMPKIMVEDLSEPRERFGRRRSPRQSKPKVKSSDINLANALSTAFAKMKPEVLKKIQERLEKKGYK